MTSVELMGVQSAIHRLKMTMSPQQAENSAIIACIAAIAAWIEKAEREKASADRIE